MKLTFDRIDRICRMNDFKAMLSANFLIL